MKVERETVRRFRSDNGRVYQTLEGAKSGDAVKLMEDLAYDLETPLRLFLGTAFDDPRLVLVLKRRVEGRQQGSLL